jgi:hypothetical protein
MDRSFTVDVDDQRPQPVAFSTSTQNDIDPKTQGKEAIKTLSAIGMTILCVMTAQIVTVQEKVLPRRLSTVQEQEVFPQAVKQVRAVLCIDSMRLVQK